MSMIGNLRAATGQAVVLDRQRQPVPAAHLLLLDRQPRDVHALRRRPAERPGDILTARQQQQTPDAEEFAHLVSFLSRGGVRTRSVGRLLVLSEHDPGR